MKNNDLKEEFCTVKEFSLKLKVHCNTVRRAIKNGHISAFKVGAGKKSPYRIPLSEVQRMAIINLKEIIDKIKE